MKINPLVLTVSSLSLANALVSNTCQAGSDTMCQVTFGTGMCCASISYTFQSSVQNFYGCASRAGIELVNGQIYDSYGYVGSWYCADAITVTASFAASLVALSLF